MQALWSSALRARAGQQKREEEKPSKKKFAVVLLLYKENRNFVYRNILQSLLLGQLMAILLASRWITNFCKHHNMIHDWLLAFSFLTNNCFQIWWDYSWSDMKKEQKLSVVFTKMFNAYYPSNFHFLATENDFSLTANNLIEMHGHSLIRRYWFSSWFFLLQQEIKKIPAAFFITWTQDVIVHFCRSSLDKWLYTSAQKRMICSCF